MCKTRLHVDNMNKSMTKKETNEKVRIDNI